MAEKVSRVAGRARLEVVGAAIIQGARCLVARRSATMSMPLKWEFTGGKIEPSEAPEQALRREIAEELGLEIEVGASLGVGYSADETVRLEVFRARVLAGVAEPQEHAEVAWLGAEDLAALDWADADVPIVPAVCALLKGSGAANKVQ